MNSLQLGSVLDTDLAGATYGAARGVLVPDAASAAHNMNDLPATSGLEEAPDLARRMASRVVTVPAHTGKRPHAQVLQAWEGVVLRIDGDSLWVRLTDRTLEGPDEEAELPLEEVSPDDIELVREGAIFYWTIAYHETDSPVGQRTKTSMIRFRRLPTWTARELEEARRQGAKLGEELRWS